MSTVKYKIEFENGHNEGSLLGIGEADGSGLKGTDDRGNDVIFKSLQDKPTCNSAVCF